MHAAAGSANSRTRFNALSRSRMLLNDSSLPCSTSAPATDGRAAVERVDVDGRLLVRVLAVAQRLLALPAHVQERREPFADGPLQEVRADRRVVGGDMSERLGREPLFRRVRQRAVVRLQLVEDGGVLGG